MEKYGVDEKEDPEKRAALGKKASQRKPTTCPKCGRSLEDHGEVVLCPNCGSEPFEAK